jgi:2-C-methyl-D-erythritol 4-phosphate cytidylyltransferase/2-C-methyl-D-erythritol 2,4-cyclodiphosphate synthase
MAHKRIFALIVAGGLGTRSGLDVPKQYAHIAGKPVLRYGTERFLHHSAIENVLVVIRPEHADLYQNATEDLSLLPHAIGGNTRQASVKAGLNALKAYNPDAVLIHDAARPYLSDSLIDNLVDALEKHDAVIPTLAMTDTIKQVNDGMVETTLDRSRLKRVQTPQAFAYNMMHDLHEQFQNMSFTDDAALCEHAGIEVHCTQGEETNRKLTTAEDFVMQLTPRTGLGYDVHQLIEHEHNAEKVITLCGIQILHTHYLKGHSDADVGLHAITDALLGAVGKGDIGQHFPPADPQWKGALSITFLQKAGEIIADKQGVISNIDVTLICEAPKICPHRNAMRSFIADALNIDKSNVSVKATTTEGLGFTGRREGVAAQAIATVLLP